MRNLLLTAGIAVAFGAVGSAWYLGWWQRPGSNVSLASRESGFVQGQNGDRTTKTDGSTETCETIEPLVVEGSVPGPTTTTVTGPLARVVLTPGVRQPPRPDAVPGHALRMPYADEDAIVPAPLDPLLRILETTPLSKLNIFENLKVTDPTEEAENKETTPPTENPEPMPVPDYHHHHQYCPGMSGHCPAPYQYYPRR